MYYIFKYAYPLITDTLITNAGTLTTGTTYHVENNPITYDGTTYQVTDTFVAGAVTVFTGTGSVRPIVEVPLPETAHEEIARRSAAILSGIVENFNRNEVKEREIKKQ
jgi:hypothetical protein